VASAVRPLEKLGFGGGGGGGSYNGGLDQTNTAGINLGDGKVVITW
jgi:hypothetical protein